MPRLPRPRPAPVIGLFAALALAVGCRTAPPSVARYDPAHDLGPLFQDVQLAAIFPDSKTFVDARPLLAPAELAGRYTAARGSAGFSLQRFVEQSFELPRPVGEGFHADTARPMEGHIRTLWAVRTRPPDTATDTTRALAYLDALEAEHAFWMDGAERLAPAQVYRRVVRLPDGSVLNRYWDDRAEPRPESYRPDYELAQALPTAQREAFY